MNLLVRSQALPATHVAAVSFGEPHKEAEWPDKLAPPHRRYSDDFTARFPVLVNFEQVGRFPGTTGRLHGKWNPHTNWAVCIQPAFRRAPPIHQRRCRMEHVELQPQEELQRK